MTRVSFLKRSVGIPKAQDFPIPKVMVKKRLEKRLKLKNLMAGGF